ncbi:MAG TPA: cysteine desulfurase family protein [Symbiobacteriaceae bacterium]|nr:cysteine desulfurase family protein [Symbiobacteriaceae bacterium]
MRRVYCDHSATTRCHPDVAKLMYEYLVNEFGNPSSIHAFGRRARKGVEEARQQVADLIGARATEVFFTSGGTEADNWALRGTLYANRARGNHVIITPFEHHAVLDQAEALAREGFDVTLLPLEPETGVVTEEALLEAIRPDTVLISIMFINNEVGTIQDIKGLCAAAKALSPQVVFHTDAVQAAGVVPINVKELGVDLMTVSGHKIYGPKGVGALYVKKGFRFQSIQVGGGQERKMRSGTENVPGIIGFGKAAELALKEREARSEHARQMRDRFLQGVLAMPGVRLNGVDPFVQPERRHPGNANVSVEHIEGEAMLLRMDMAGIAASSGSACTSGSLEPSHVLLAMGCSRQIAQGSLRFSFGQENTADDIDYVIDEFSKSVAFLRKLAPTGQ